MRLPDLRIARTNEFGSSKESEMRRIKNRLAAATALLLCASCGGASDQKIVADACSADGIHTKQDCSCYAKEVKANLSAEDYEVVVKQTEVMTNLAKKTKGMTTAEAMEASKGAAQDAQELLSDPARIGRIAETGQNAMNKCMK